MNDADEVELQSFLDTIPQPKSYEEIRSEIQAEQSGKSRAQIAADMARSSEFVFDPETAVAPEHNWIDRGEVMSCEGANHPNHRHFKYTKRR